MKNMKVTKTSSTSIIISGSDFKKVEKAIHRKTKKGYIPYKYESLSQVFNGSEYIMSMIKK